MPSKIEINGLQVFYGNNEVLKDINMVFPPGKVTAIIGPSGCGKTTLIRCLNRLNELTPGCKMAGSILLDDKDISQIDPVLLRRQIGMVFQKPNPFPMSLKDNILYGVKACKRNHISHDDLIKDTLSKAALWEELQDRLNMSAMALSVGQQQRLCIARCLAISPQVVLMDEPAASLDPISTAKLESSIIALKDNYTIVIVTHNMQEAQRVSDYIAFLYLGKLIEFGETKKMFESPEHNKTRDYVCGKFG